MTLTDILVVFGLLSILVVTYFGMIFILHFFRRRNGFLHQPLKNRLLVSYLKHYNNL